jgi:hypothetical protein
LEFLKGNLGTLERVLSGQFRAFYEGATMKLLLIRNVQFNGNGDHEILVNKEVHPRDVQQRCLHLLSRS